jgi:hypothetical protein
MSTPVTILFDYPSKIYSGIFGTTVNNLEDYLNLTGYKVSELVLELNNTFVSDINIYEEGWWELEHEIQDNYFGFVNYHFRLEVYSDENMTEPAVFTSDSFSLDGWSYETSLKKYESIPVGGVPSSYIGRKIRYQSRQDALISLDEYLTRGHTYYFRIKQYDAINGTEFGWTYYNDIIWT